ncbi:MAG: hypothetical protein AAGG44_13595 [Planctomycetota bacterium]
MKKEYRFGVASFCYLCGILLWHSDANAQSRFRDGVMLWKNGDSSHTGRTSTWFGRDWDSHTAEWPPNPNYEARILRFLASETEICMPGISIQQLVDITAQHVPVLLVTDEIELLGVDLESASPRVPRASVYAQLLAALTPFELTVHLRRGMLIVTSMDHADSDFMVRTYEIAVADSQRSYDFDSLMHQLRIHVDPDSWMVSGGVSCITMH